MRPGVGLRDCRESDLAEIVTIEERVYTLEGPWDDEDYREELRDPACVAVVSTDGDGKVIGYAFGTIDEGVVEVISLTTAEHCRRRGVGRLLLEEILRRGREAGASSAVLEVREGNTGAIGLYVDSGFRPVRRIPDLYDTGVHALEMRCTLA